MIKYMVTQFKWFFVTMYICLVPLCLSLFLAQSASEISNYFHTKIWLIYASVLVIDLPYLAFVGLIMVGVFAALTEAIFDWWINSTLRISLYNIMSIEQN